MTENKNVLQPQVQNTRYYLILYLDLFNNEILDWELSNTFDNFLVMKSAKRILKKTKSTGTQILLHSDQGVLRSDFKYWRFDNLNDVISQAGYYFNYIKPLRKLSRKTPVQYRIEPAA